MLSRLGLSCSLYILLYTLNSPCPFIFFSFLLISVFLLLRSPHLHLSFLSYSHDFFFSFELFQSFAFTPYIHFAVWIWAARWFLLLIAVEMYITSVFLSLSLVRPRLCLRSRVFVFAAWLISLQLFSSFAHI